jgi:hypothetical protein
MRIQRGISWLGVALIWVVLCSLATVGGVSILVMYWLFVNVWN